VEIDEFPITVSVIDESRSSAGDTVVLAVAASEDGSVATGVSVLSFEISPGSLALTEREVLQPTEPGRQHFGAFLVEDSMFAITQPLSGSGSPQIESLDQEAVALTLEGDRPVIASPVLLGDSVGILRSTTVNRAVGNRIDVFRLEPPTDTFSYDAAQSFTLSCEIRSFLADGTNVFGLTDSGVVRIEP
jgi:hypothetical protein